MKSDDVKAKVMTAWIRDTTAAQAKAIREDRPYSSEASEVWRTELEKKYDSSIVTVLESKAWANHQRSYYECSFVLADDKRGYQDYLLPADCKWCDKVPSQFRVQLGPVNLLLRGERLNVRPAHLAVHKGNYTKAVGNWASDPDSFRKFRAFNRAQSCI